MNVLLLPWKRQSVARKTSRSSSQDFKAASLINTYVPEYNIKRENIRTILPGIMALLRHTETSWSSCSFQILGALG